MTTLELVAFAIFAVTASVVAVDIKEAMKLTTKPRNRMRYGR